MNDGKTERFKFSYQRIGRMLASLGFKKGKASDGGSAIFWDDNLIKKFLLTYGLQERSVMSETSVIPNFEGEND
ncbi:MAG: hypothetical protein A2Z83_06365 [Omnitrophica bacterium GWA2_52_8]|nr:MAG: hypothetical protein A2Z83_06365 [Omnitrophica bacterium GWA2_52_8]